ncbi:hypothetical protein EJB05_27840, partial [Eragrostis curvula]
MGDISQAILWWDEWQLRILVLGSLGLQFFLLLTAPMRKYTIGGFFRRCIWLAYVSSDALAIYALATLFNRHAKASSACAYGDKASSLEILWAPILLVHLGGREEITAFNIEDNELWTRHTVSLVSQVTVAIYAFYKSWPDGNDRRLLWSAIMLFICGIINFCEKPWALRSASINRLVAMSSIIKGERREPTRWEQCFTEVKWNWRKKEDDAVLSEMDQVQMILSDMSMLAATRGGKAHLAKLAPGADMTRWLLQAFELIYTRATVAYSPVFIACNFVLVPSLHVAAIILFAVSRKKGYADTDVMMTYILMCFTAVLDVLGVFISKLVYKLMSFTKVPALCLTLPEHNLINSVYRRMKPSTGWLYKCAASIGCNFNHDAHSAGSKIRVADFVLYKLLKPGKVKNLDLASYRSLTATNNWALGDLGDFVRGNAPNVRRILCESPFDESVLVWHIATDLCFRVMGGPQSHREVCTKVISNYMAHLLNSRPEMLMTGSRKHLLTQAMEDLEKLLKNCRDKRLAKIIIEEGKSLGSGATDIPIEQEDERGDASLIQEACNLADELISIRDDEKRWKLLYRVWMGMLCYSASMCRGYLHAKALGEGGEFLSFVWLVISLKGAKTLADKLQMPQEQHKEGNAQESPEESDDITAMFSRRP